MIEKLFTSKSFVFLIIISLVLTAGCIKSSFEVTRISVTPNQVYSGESATVNVEIKNLGKSDGVYLAGLYINGVEREEKEVFIRKNSIKEVTFTISEQTPGTYDISVGGNYTTYTVLKQPTGEEIVENVIDSMYDTKSYQFEQDLSISITGIIDGDEAKEEMNIGLVGTADRSNRKLRAEGDAKYDLIFPHYVESLTRIKLYNIGDTCYMFNDFGGGETVWEKEHSSLDNWENVSGIELVLKLLKFSEAKYIGEEKIRGRDCYVLQVIPSKDELVDVLIKSGVISYGGLPFVISVYYELAEDSEVRYWIYTGNHYLGKYEISAQESILASMLERWSGKGFVEVDYIISGTFYNYNEQVDIELPPDAQELFSLDEGTVEEDTRDVEFANVQDAVYTMMVDNEISVLPNPVDIPTNDMSVFPDAISKAGSSDKAYDVDGSTYTSGDLNGYVLYQHDRIADGKAYINLVNYLTSQYMGYKYTVDVYGKITQWD